MKSCLSVGTVPEVGTPLQHTTIRTVFRRAFIIKLLAAINIKDVSSAG
jgi:hypothetical protein